MNAMLSNTMPRRQRGQTIIIALIVLGLLLILGFVFIGLIDLNAKSSYNLGNRSLARDLAYGGVKFAHQELLTSELGADWRGTPTNLGAADTTLDPDIYYLRPPATLLGGAALTVTEGGSQIDLGGPDGLGPYFRVNNSNGRSLLRIRYAPSDANIFSNSPTGPLRHPGLARDYIIIESVGRPGAVNINDPTTLSSGTPVHFRRFNSDTEFRQVFGQMKQAETLHATTQVVRAFCSIGLIESARYITNKYHGSRPADIGTPKELEPIYNGVALGTALKYQLGNSQPLYNLGLQPTPAGLIEGNGSFYCNAGLVVHGNVQVLLNRFMGDQFDVAGAMQGDLPDNSGYQGGQLQVGIRDVLPNGTWATLATATLSELGAQSLDSNNPGFNTLNGTVRDGSAVLDQQNFPRSVGYKAPPSIETTDPDTGENKYAHMTQVSGVAVGAYNDGLFGHGGSLYVNNPSDVQGPTDEQGRQNSGTQTSLVYDWLNPNNGQPHSGWQGYYYIPPGASVNLQYNGFTVQRSSTAPQNERTWRYVDGSDTQSSTIIYRIGLGTDGRRHIVNSFTPVAFNTPTTTINITGNLTGPDYDKGPVFTGVLYFAGNVRIRGTIPTDVQMTLVSNASIYIEGSITKGVSANGLQVGEGYTNGQLITRPSKSMIALLAKDNVVLNTTQFLGLAPSEQVQPVNDTPNSNGFNPIRISQGGTLLLDTEFVRDPLGPGANATNPSTWKPYAASYYQFGTPANKLSASLLMAHTMDDGPAAATFFQADVNIGVPNVNRGIQQASPYFFLRSGNTAGAYIAGVSPTLQVYGLGSEIYQRYPKFEQTTFTLVDPSTVQMSADGQSMTANGPTGIYALLTEGTNEIALHQQSVAGVATNDYLVGRAALIPGDVRIDATIYAEEGSFFVIPGPWFNPNPNDRRDTYMAGSDVYASAGTPAEKDAIRLEQFGSMPGMPFYEEPLDIRIVINGAVSENMPPPASVQAEWLKKWGWIPAFLGSTGSLIPQAHVPTGYDITPGNPGSSAFVPNLIINYDSALATGRSNGFVNDNNANTLIRVDDYGRALPPMPRLPVSPTLAYFGEVH